ncbi:MAG TPA: DNA gyrase inhibitor YacG [Polaromonas sp.]|uniref:DNA gyrase inhibitor YacG n=1 Tax=Polaromonas sp. UBA4122 TaxID=1947074 RepID=UPI000ECED592|nr:DNA gyrase inhibitor YacG [Polaromonas sp. UBA4122]HAL38367.1 DNA gyrase inhibitor YacG [Polaromonas sp.]
MPDMKKDKDPLPVKRVVCPSCGGQSVYAASNPFRPFCSERCKNIDLGAWASEDFRLPAEPPRDDEAYGDPTLSDPKLP